MTFASPMGLWFLLAALPVIALHLLKPRRAEVTVSSSMLWEDETVGATAASPCSACLQHCCFFCSCSWLSSGFALGRSRGSGDAGLAEHTVVVLDTSASMGSLDGEPDRFADAQAQAISLFQEIPRGGRVSLVTAGPTPRCSVSATTDAASFEGAVRAVRLSDGPADLRAAMALADGLETPDAQLGIVLISDGAHTPAGWRRCRLASAIGSLARPM